MVKRKPQKSPKGSDKNKKGLDIAKIFLGKEAVAAASKSSGEKSTKSNPGVARVKSTKKISVPVKISLKKKSVKSKKGQSSTKESNPRLLLGFSRSRQPPIPRRKTRPPTAPTRKSSAASRPKNMFTIDVSCFGPPWILGLRIKTHYWR